MSKIHAIIVAAGSGTRFGGPLPKQFMPLGGIPVAMRSVLALREACADIVDTGDYTDTIVLAESEVERWLSLCHIHCFKSPVIAQGGETRFESVKNALGTAPTNADIIMIHDGARPFPSGEMVRRLITALSDADIHGAIPTVSVTDSLREVKKDKTSVAVDRSRYRAVQTPQAFQARLLCEAYSLAATPAGFTDDASVMESAGFNRLTLVEGSIDNIKITNPHDLVIAEAILSML